MGSAEPERSLNSGISLPQWMKNKVGDRYDLDETFSPPSHDDSFFYIRYPKTERPTRQLQQEPSFRQASELLEKSERIAKQDFSQHTLQCRQFIPDARMAADVSGPADTLVGSTKILRATKPVGTDDNFTGDTAACGKSVVQVAHQMIAGSLLVRGFSTTENEKVATGEGFNRNIRRGSKSLPASPLTSPQTSPQTRRKVQNRYFTGAFTMEKGNIQGGRPDSKYHGSWILSGLLGQQQRENMSESMDSITIPEEDHKEVSSSPEHHVEKHSPSDIRRNKSMTTLVSKMLSEGPKDNDQQVEIGVDAAATAANSSEEDSPPLQSKTFRAKPSELREMNFWSPTSM